MASRHAAVPVLDAAPDSEPVDRAGKGRRRGDKTRRPGAAKTEYAPEDGNPERNIARLPGLAVLTKPVLRSGVPKLRYALRVVASAVLVAEGDPPWVRWRRC
jgi:hypothetical protein